MPPTQPLTFEPIFMERIWGGRRLESLYGKHLPPKVLIGESWEIVDRAEAQSVVSCGPWRGRTLHAIWSEERSEVFGPVPNAHRFPLLLKLLDAEEKLSLQVHPPASVAQELGGEPKTEFWYVAAAEPQAELFVGLKKGSSREKIEQAIASGGLEQYTHRIQVQAGDGMFIPSGRMHAIGAGNLIVEVQQNSDTTYRVFDWNRMDSNGHVRELHVKESMRSIDFGDYEPELVGPVGESLVRQDHFDVEKWNLDAEREASGFGKFAIVCCLTGKLDCAGVFLNPGEFFLVPASLKDRALKPKAPYTSLLRVTIPS